MDNTQRIVVANAFADGIYALIDAISTGAIASKTYIAKEFETSWQSK